MNSKPEAVAPFKDPAWRRENFYFIVDKKGRKVRFRKNNVQRVVDSFAQKRRRILKARQLGISTNELINLLDWTIFTPNITTCILAHEQDAIEKLFRIPRRAYNFMHPAIQPTIDKGGGSKYEMFFPKINSRIYCDLESRGDTIHRLHISERAFISDPDRVYATLEAVPHDGYVTMESTPNGIGNDFYDDWMDPESNYTNIFLPWFFHEEYAIHDHALAIKDLRKDELEFIEKAAKRYNVVITLEQIAFRRFKQRELKSVFFQEYPEDDITCFLTSGRAPMDLAIVKQLYDSAPKPIAEDRDIRIYEHMQRGQQYVCGADVAEGVDGDHSAFHIMKVKNRQIVASFNSAKIPVSDFAELLDYGCKLYSRHFPILLGVERNNHGHAVLLKLDEILKYPNLYRAEDEKLGWLSNKVTRPLMIDQFIEAIESKFCDVQDRITLNQCLTLVEENGKIQHATNKHDDLFIAGAITLQMALKETHLDIYDDIKSKIRV